MSIIAWLDLDFMTPWVLWFLLIVPLYAWFLLRRKRVSTSFYTNKSNAELDEISVSWPQKFLKLRDVLRLIILTLGIVTLAHPFSYDSKNSTEDYKEGIEIVLAMDVSLSMYAKDFEPNRLEAAKSVAKNFVSGRNGDRIGLVIYAGEAFTACPSTLDYQVVQQQIEQISGEFLEGGTAIGVGLGTAVSRLRGDSLSTKVIILMTDGSNNAGELTPDMAAELALAKNVRVYTIGVGSNGNALSPVVTPFGIRFENIPVEIDEETLRSIAKRTGGRYYRATDESSLKNIYSEIDKIEKTRFMEEVYQGAPPVKPEIPLIILFSLFIALLFVQILLIPHYE